MLSSAPRARPRRASQFLNTPRDGVRSESSIPRARGGLRRDQRKSSAIGQARTATIRVGSGSTRSRTMSARHYAFAGVRRHWPRALSPPAGSRSAPTPNRPTADISLSPRASHRGTAVRPEWPAGPWRHRFGHSHGPGRPAGFGEGLNSRIPGRALLFVVPTTNDRRQHGPGRH